MANERLRLGTHDQVTPEATVMRSSVIGPTGSHSVIRRHSVFGLELVRSDDELTTAEAEDRHRRFSFGRSGARGGHQM